jgi:hypothetical protein
MAPTGTSHPRSVVHVVHWRMQQTGSRSNCRDPPPPNVVALGVGYAPGPPWGSPHEPAHPLRRSRPIDDRRLRRSPARPEAAWSGRKLPARLHIVGIVLHAIARRAGRHRQAGERYLSVGLDLVRLILPAQRKRAALKSEAKGSRVAGKTPTPHLIVGTVDRSASFAAWSNSCSSHSDTPISPSETFRAHSTYSSRRLTDQSGGGLAAMALKLLVLSASLRIFARCDFSCECSIWSRFRSCFSRFLSSVTFTRRRSA